MHQPTIPRRMIDRWQQLQARLDRGWRTMLERAGLSTADEPEPVDDGFLPDFCSASVIVNVVIIAEIFAFVITLVTRRISFSILNDLLVISLFIQWIALASVAALCYARRYLNRMSKLRALGLAYLLLLIVTVLISEAAVWVWYFTGGIKSARPEWYAYFHIQNFTVSLLVNALVLRYILAKHEIKQRTYSETRAKIQALQSRIRPHFVFNSLNIIASLTRNEPARAEAAIEDMADLFRMMLSEDEQLVPVKKEIDVAKKYLAIETLRLDNRLHVNWDIGTFPRKAAMPVLTLQPLLENAVRHGIESLATGGTIDVKLWEHENNIHIRVENPFSHNKSKAGAESRNRSLDNIRQRLQSHYGETARLEASGDQNRYIVSVVLPTRGGNV
jgi:two-component system, LytTR family, sensor histidine kinase AlgZ